MKNYIQMNKQELIIEHERLQKEYDDFKARGLSLDMSRGKPDSDQLDLSQCMLDTLNSKSDCKTEDGTDCRNYGILDGISSMKRVFSQILGVKPENIIVGGNSSLNMMFDTISCFMTTGVAGCDPWIKQGEIKFLCPVPGYDRHFGVTQYYGIKMINVPMSATGPDMDMIEYLVSSDEAIKGMWCVPKYSNPQGITYSDETVRRLAALKPKAKDFRIMWDNAYCVHDVTDTPDNLLNLMDECIRNGNEDLPIMFTSTSKITFPGSGVAAMAASEANLKVFKERYKYQTIGYDKLNMLRHARFFGDYDGILAHMKKHKEILAPKFNTVVDKLESKLGGTGAAQWIKPNGGYFVSVDVMNGCAKRVVELCRNAGVKLTDAGATYPYGIDPNDSNIRIAPSYPSSEELALAMDLFCLCTSLAVTEKLILEDENQ